MDWWTFSSWSAFTSLLALVLLWYIVSGIRFLSLRRVPKRNSSKEGKIYWESIFHPFQLKFNVIYYSGLEAKQKVICRNQWQRLFSSWFPGRRWRQEGTKYSTHLSRTCLSDILSLATTQNLPIHHSMKLSKILYFNYFNAFWVLWLSKPYQIFETWHLCGIFYILTQTLLNSVFLVLISWFDHSLLWRTILIKNLNILLCILFASLSWVFWIVTFIITF